MKEIIADTKLLGYCGIYCGACRKYLKGKCEGCIKNVKATWCQVRVCCIENGYVSCADCKIVDKIEDCKKYNTFFEKVFGFIMRTDRKAGVQLIKEKGVEDFINYMVENKLVCIKKQ